MTLDRHNARLKLNYCLLPESPNFLLLSTFNSFILRSHLDALAGEEADVEAPLAPPPDGLVRLGHVDHRDHVTHLE
jgi:hypothetical protein